MQSNPSSKPHLTPGAGSAKTTRRQFLKNSAASAFAFQFVPSSVWGSNERIQVASVGIGGKGYSDVQGAADAGGEIVALCDVHDGRRVRRGKDHIENFPRARFYRDFRVMLEKEDRHIDAVTVSTPDHTHFHASMAAMQLGKHVYCQKPLTHSIWEARMMAKAAKKYGVATQMGNQAHAGEPIRRAVELVRAGIIGKVNEVHCWTNRPIWPQGVAKRPEPMAVPSGLDWDLWLGPAPFRLYSDAYVPFKWRGWWDFGTGALGDMGCHIMDMPYWSLGLNHPTSVEAQSEGGTEESGPTAATVTYSFPAGRYSNELKFVWYDGNRMPSRDVIGELDLTEEEVARQFDLVMVGEKGKFFFKRSSTDWVVKPSGDSYESEETARWLPRVKDEDIEWIEACKGGAHALSNFAYAGPFTEVVLLGNLAVRAGRKIEWDGVHMKATNAPELEPLVRRAYRNGWEV